MRNIIYAVWVELESPAQECVGFAARQVMGNVATTHPLGPGCPGTALDLGEHSHYDSTYTDVPAPVRLIAYKQSGSLEQALVHTMCPPSQVT